MVIYKITNLVNGKVYIGKTINKPRNRFLAHLKEARNGSQYYLHRAIRKYGKDNFKFEVIDDSAKTIEELDKLEVYYIQLYRSTESEYGYNMHLGGSSNIMFSPIIKQHHAEKLRSPETRNNISKGMKAYRSTHPFTAEHRANLSKALMGNHNFKDPRTRCVPCYCIDENGVRHDFDCYKNGAIWWFENYKPFGDRLVLVTLVRKINASIKGELKSSVTWFKV